MALDAPTALLVVAAGHVGLQLTVTTLVYPALAAIRPDDWALAHERHSRRITPLVVLAYGGLVLAGGWVAVSEPFGLALAVALAAAVATIVLTGAVAAPLHGRLGRVGPEPALLGRLLVVDRIRLVLALLTLLAAASAALVA